MVSGQMDVYPSVTFAQVTRVYMDSAQTHYLVISVSVTQAGLEPTAQKTLMSV